MIEKLTKVGLSEQRKHSFWQTAGAKALVCRRRLYLLTQRAACLLLMLQLTELEPTRRKDDVQKRIGSHRTVKMDVFPMI